MATMTAMRLRRMARLWRNGQPGARELLEIAIDEHREQVSELLAVPAQSLRPELVLRRVEELDRLAKERAFESARSRAVALARAVSDEAEVVDGGEWALPVAPLAELARCRGFRHVMFLRHGIVELSVLDRVLRACGRMRQLTLRLHREQLVVGYADEGTRGQIVLRVWPSSDDDDAVAIWLGARQLEVTACQHNALRRVGFCEHLTRALLEATS